MRQISKKQIAMIHIAKSKLGITETEYKSMLAGFDVESSKDLSQDQAKAFINLLEKAGFKTVDKRPGHTGHLTAAQLRMLRGMWFNSSVIKNKTEEALNKFCKRITGIDRIDWLNNSTFAKFKVAVEELTQQKYEDYI